MIALSKVVALVLPFVAGGSLALDRAIPERAPSYAVDDRALDRWLKRLADSAGFSGVVLVERGGKVVLDRAYQPIGKAKITTQSAFWLASTTKQFTAAAVLKLVDQGKLAVSDSLYHFFRRLPREARGITVEQLLTHTSGIAA